MGLLQLAARQLAKVPPARAHDVFYQRGFHLLPRHFYSPVPEIEDIPVSYWEQVSDMPGVDVNETAALEFLRDVLSPHMTEFRNLFPLNAPQSSSSNPRQFYLLNGTYMAVDAHVYYAIIRQTQPAQIVEVGAGNSTLLAVAAGRRNQQAGGLGPEMTLIEPYPWEVFEQGLPGVARLLRQRLQDVDRSLFEELTAGDILFIDSSHVLRAGNDVEMLYLEILPRLNPGVLVHIHDVSLPRPYPRLYFEQRTYWNEQQLLQAFLAFNSAFEVVWPANLMLIRHPGEVRAVVPEVNAMRERFPSAEPTAFWIRRR